MPLPQHSSNGAAAVGSGLTQPGLLSSASLLGASELRSGAPAGAPATALKKCSKKIILLGHFGVGKSSLVKRFVHSMFSSDYQTTIGVKIDKKVLLTPTHEMKMLLWDIEGAPDQTRLPRSYFMGAHGILYVCDVTRPATYERLDEAIPQLHEKSPGAALVVLGNKTDLVGDQQIDDLTAAHPDRFDFLCSAGTGVNVESAFETLAHKILAR